MYMALLPNFIIWHLMMSGAVIDLLVDKNRMTIELKGQTVYLNTATSIDPEFQMQFQSSQFLYSAN